MEYLFEFLQNEHMEIVTSEKKIAQMDPCKYILDARSAAFYAFGKSLKEKTAVALIVNGNHLTSVLTAATEAWFQKANVLIIALWNQYSDLQYSYFERCVVACHTVDKISQTLLWHSVEKKGPVLVNLVCGYTNEETYDYGSVPVWMGSEKLYLYQPDKSYDGDNVRGISAQHGYGVLSRYMGMMSVSEKPVYLCCPAECLLLDLNVFNNRYSVRKTRIIVLDQENILGQNNVDKWLESNGIRCIYVDILKEKQITDLKTAEEATAIIVRKGIS